MEQNSNEKRQRKFIHGRISEEETGSKNPGNSFACRPGSRFCQCITDCSILFMIRIVF